MQKERRQTWNTTIRNTPEIVLTILIRYGKQEVSATSKLFDLGQVTNFSESDSFLVKETS